MTTIFDAVNERITSYLIHLLNDSNNVVDLEETLPNGNTLLTLAAQKGYDDIVEVLIKEGAEINNPNVLGNTALMEACDKGYISVCKILLSMGAFINTTNHKGESPLTKAIQGSHKTIFRELLANGVDFGRNVIKIQNPEFAALLINHILQIKTDLKNIIKNTLKNKLVEKEVFPMRCLSLNEESKFEIRFNYEKPLLLSENVGSNFLFIAEAMFLSQMDLDELTKPQFKCGLRSGLVINAALNCTMLTPISESVNVYNFNPEEGSNSLILNTIMMANSKVKLIVIAYVCQHR